MPRRRRSSNPENPKPGAEDPNRAAPAAQGAGSAANGARNSPGGGRDSSGASRNQPGSARKSPDSGSPNSGANRPGPARRGGAGRRRGSQPAGSPAQDRSAPADRGAVPGQSRSGAPGRRSSRRRIKRTPDQPAAPAQAAKQLPAAKQQPAAKQSPAAQQNRRRNRRAPGFNTPFTRQAPSVPIPTNRGIKARSQRGNFSQNWWARRWIEAMEQLVDPARLQRGRSYARQGQVLTLEETVLGVEAKVQGSRQQPYRVIIQVTHLTDEQWDQVINAMSEQALFTAQLLAGEMPTGIEDAFNTAGVSLFPDQLGDLHSDCSCPDWANPCKHVAATHYILGDRFDDDPFLLFRMRGRTQEQILEALRQRRAGEAAEEEPAEPETPAEQGQQLSELMDRFWEPAESLDTFPLTIRPPTVDMPLLKRLGDPAFLGGESLQTILKPVYDTLMRSALLAAYSEEEPFESNNGDNGLA